MPPIFPVAFTPSAALHSPQSRTKLTEKQNLITFSCSVKANFANKLSVGWSRKFLVYQQEGMLRRFCARLSNDEQKSMSIYHWAKIFMAELCRDEHKNEISSLISRTPSSSLALLRPSGFFSTRLFAQTNPRGW